MSPSSSMDRWASEGGAGRPASAPWCSIKRMAFIGSEPVVAPVNDALECDAEVLHGRFPDSPHPSAWCESGPGERERPRDVGDGRPWRAVTAHRSRAVPGRWSGIRQCDGGSVARRSDCRGTAAPAETDDATARLRSPGVGRRSLLRRRPAHSPSSLSGSRRRSSGASSRRTNMPRNPCRRPGRGGSW